MPQFSVISLACSFIVFKNLSNLSRYEGNSSKVLIFQGGGWRGNRTHDTRIFSPPLYQLSYPAETFEKSDEDCMQTATLQAV